MSILTVNNLSAGYGKKIVICDMAFEVNAGEIFGIVGANGSGKSTLIKAVCNIHRHDGFCCSDEVRLENLSSRELADIISYVPQRSGISIDISVLDVVLMGVNSKLKLFQNPGRDMIEEAKKKINLVGLTEKENSNYMQLSEGQKQLCILARALMADGKILVLDEPESALDFSVRYNMMHIIREWSSKEERASIIALHDINLALNYCDRILLLKDTEELGIISPKKDDIAYMESMLSAVYGDISVNEITNKAGNKKYVMINELEK